MRYREYLRLKWDRDNPLFRRRLGPGPVAGLLLFLANGAGALTVLWSWGWVLENPPYWRWANIAAAVTAIVTLWLASGRMSQPMLEELSLTGLSRQQVAVALLRSTGWVYFPSGLAWIAGYTLGSYLLVPQFWIRNTVGNSLGGAAALLVVCSAFWAQGPLPGLGYPFGAFGQYFAGLLAVACLLAIGLGFPGLERFHREQLVAGEGAA